MPFKRQLKEKPQLSDAGARF